MRKGSHHTEETKRKMSLDRSGDKNVNYGKIMPEETRRKISDSLVGKRSGEKNGFFGKRHSEKTKAEMSEKRKGKPKESHPNFGKHLSEETRKNISIALSGENNPNFGKRGEETSMFGKRHSPKTKAKMSESRLRVVASEESRKNMSKSKTGEKHPMFGKHHTKESKLKISFAVKGEKNPMYGKCGVLAPGFGKIGEKNAMFGKHHSEESKQKMSASRLGKNIGDKNPGWKGGISFEPYCPKFNGDLKRRVRHFFDNSCLLCGKSRHENGQELSVHHVEYNKNACCDGKLVTFASLCRKCHSKTSGKNRQTWEDMLHVIIDYLYEGKSYYTKDEYEVIRKN